MRNWRRPCSGTVAHKARSPANRSPDLIIRTTNRSGRFIVSIRLNSGSSLSPLAYSLEVPRGRLVLRRTGGGCRSAHSPRYAGVPAHQSRLVLVGLRDVRPVVLRAAADARVLACVQRGRDEQQLVVVAHHGCHGGGDAVGGR